MKKIVPLALVVPAFAADGNLEPDFRPVGELPQIFRVFSIMRANALTIQSHGKIVAAGLASSGSNQGGDSRRFRQSPHRF